MEHSIIQQLELIEESILWVNTSIDGEKQKNACRNMVNIRRKLKKKKFALEGNPAAALFGESQAGKSYLVSALLAETGKPFQILDGNGNEYDFKNQINPRGNEMESTSVITRFSTKYKVYHQNFPIIAKLLTVTDIIILICEAYYNNLKVNNPLGFDEIKEKIIHFENLYNHRADSQKLIIEDDVLNIEEYFENNFSKLVYNNIKDAHFFEKISLISAKIPPEEWKVVFSLLWNFNPQLNKLFDDLIKQYQLLNFVDTVYLPIDAVVRNKGTLLDVNRLDEIYGTFKGQETDYEEQTNILYRENGKDNIVKFSKPFLCAFTSELIFALPNTIINEKPFLAQTDLLDFPGTRRFESTNEDNISDKSLTDLLRRGKVDYLFNKYSNNECINTLLFCQNHKQSNQSVLPEKLNRWIGSMMGKSKIERENFKSPISPLFVISTWFNKDLEFDLSNDKVGENQSLNERWNQRFCKTLEEQIFKVHEFPWLIEWTITKPNFQNIFLLRDFEKSGLDVQNCSNIYKGYNETKKEIEEIVPDSYPTFRKDLRQSFIEFPFIKRHFENPEESWDKAASMNEDGTKLIIEKLSIAADNINPARIKKMRTELEEITAILLAELLKHFHSNDKDDALKKAKSTAGDIQHRLDSAFSADGIKLYGQLMKDFMLDESSVLELYRKKLEDIEHREVKNLDKYSNYRIQVSVMPNDTVETYFERLCIKYEKITAEQKQQFLEELNSKQIDLNDLLNGNSKLIKNNAEQLADALIDYWLAYITLSDKQTIQNILVNEGSSALQDIAEMFQKLFKKLELADKIARKIRRFVDVQNKVDLPYEIVADISAELLNKCINTVGFDYFDQSEKNDLILANEKNNLGIEINETTSQNEKSVAELFTKIENWTDIIQNNPNELKTLPSYHNYLLWYNRLKIGFVSVCDIPNYNVEANEKLGVLINKCETIKY